MNKLLLPQIAVAGVKLYSWALWHALVCQFDQADSIASDSCMILSLIGLDVI
ncbi:hypothetical protein [uncultured Duncaniella sp.]|uniref:hypothetical protein n=1 Tax=uncultured Duncaniella sp. TaxID=2768039 RepID=UPI002730D235|nr:hypothetical protein [uncultured Duncaniella sp.]